MIQHSDGPKTYWGYYQDYLVQIYGKKIPQKLTSIFGQKSKFPKGIYSMAKKLAEMATAGDVQILA